MSVIKYLFIYCSDDLGRLYGPTRALYGPSSSGLARALAIAISSPVNKKRKQAKEGTGLSFKQTPVNLDIIHLISQWLTQSEFSLNSVMVYIDAGEYGVLRWKTTDQSSYY